MIYVSQGHENGIGLEIFLKSYLSLPSEDQKIFTLAVEKQTFSEHLKMLSLKTQQFKNLNVFFTNSSSVPQSTNSLEWCLTQIKENDILVTLPTSKDQLIYKNQNQSGYTEYFRSYFGNKNISMAFKSFKNNTLLITDHISLNQVSHYVDNQLLEEKIKLTLTGFQKYFYAIEELFVAGINPHAGENGLLGKEEIALSPTLKSLSKNCKVFVSDFLSGDTLHVYENFSKKQLFVYMFHDQGLAKFKAQNGFIGLNVTFGLPFLRLSVDHGTAFNMYGKNCANISGMIYLFKEALEVHKNVNQRN
jgi:4-hydroxythreonine-4-phosphate dehydrogenase